MKLMSYQVYVKNDYDRPFNNKRCKLVFKEKRWNSSRGTYYREYYVVEHGGECIKTGTKAELRRWLKRKKFYVDPFDSVDYQIWTKDWKKVFIGLTYLEVGYPPTRWLYRVE